MKFTSLLGHTLELFDLTVREKSPADQVVDKFFRARRYLGSKDRRFISESVYGMLRHKLRIEEVFRQAIGVERGIGTGHHNGSSVGLYATYLLTVEEKAPQYLFENLRSYWNIHFPRVRLEQITEKILLHRELDFAPSDPATRLSLKHSFPKWMVEEWLEQFGEPETEDLCDALNKPAPLTIRVNTLKTTVEECQRRLMQEGIESTPTQLSLFGLHLGKRVNFQTLGSFKDGWFEVQDEGSQILPLLTDPDIRRDETIVDACAGGGGKTLELAALMENQGRILAFDVDKRRLGNLEHRAQRAGARNVEVRLLDKGSRQEGRDDIGKVDAVFIDAPCSGLGTLRRNPGNKWKVSQRFVDEVAAQQRRLLEEWSRVLQPGGRLVYATCTIMRKENENVVEEFLNSHRHFTLVSASEVLARRGLADHFKDRYLRLYPHRHGTDGFFAAVMVLA